MEIPGIVDSSQGQSTPTPSPAPQAVEGSQAELQAPIGQPTQTGLEKFHGLDGNVDVSKLGQSYLEVERTMRQTQNDLAAARKAQEDMLAYVTQQQALPQIQQQAPLVPQKTSDEILKEFVEDPSGVLNRTVQESLRPVSQQIQQMALHTMHPELKDPTFTREIRDFVKNLPPVVQTLENTVEGADYLVKLFKQTKSPAQVVTQPMATSLAPSGSGGGGSKPSYRRSEIRNLISTDPRRYAMLQGEIESAYKEGRVIAD